MTWNPRAPQGAVELESIVFFLLSISSFYAAEALGSNGIISTWICGLATRHWTFYNLGADVQHKVGHCPGHAARPSFLAPRCRTPPPHAYKLMKM